MRVTGPKYRTERHRIVNVVPNDLHMPPLGGVFAGKPHVERRIVAGLIILR